MRFRLCAFLFFIVCRSFSQSGTDSLVNLSSGTTSQIDNPQSAVANKNDISVASDSLSKSQKRKESRKQRNKKVKSKSKDVIENKNSQASLKNDVPSKISKDSVSTELKDKASNSKLNKEYQSKSNGVIGKGNDSASLKDSVSSKLKDKASNNELTKKYSSKYEGVAGIGKDSLAKDSLKNNLKKKIPTDQLKNKVPGQLQGIGSKKDSLLSEGKSKIKDVKTNSVGYVKKQIKTMKPTGSISGGYEYGVIPFVVGDKYPSGGFRSEGTVSMFVFKVPIEFTYNYSTIKNTIGLNNYYRISYDANRYKDVVSQKLNSTYKMDVDQLSKLEVQQQQLMQKTEMLSFLKNNPYCKVPSTNALKNSATSKLNSDNLKDSLGSAIPDTTGKLSSFSKPNTDSLNNNSTIGIENNPLSKLNIKTNKDSLDLSTVDTSKISSSINTLGKTAPDSVEVSSKPINDSVQDNSKDSVSYVSRKDSISAELSVCKEKYDSVKTEIEKVKAKIEKVKRLIEDPMGYTDPYLSKAERFLSGIKKLEIGLCNPNYSTFLVNNVPLQGINIEYGKKDKFVAFSYGTTVATLLYNPNTLQGTLQGARNMYNYFDFGNLSAGRKIICLKGGVGQKEETHLYAGFLLGKGKSDYMYTGVDAGSTALSKESNLVLEIDGKYKFSEQVSVDVLLGKSSIKENDLSTEQVSNMLNEVMSNFRSYALAAKLNLGISKTNTKLTFSTRWIDPYFKSFGLGFLRSDNWRYEVKVEQQITKKIKYSIAYRKEEDNLLRLYNYKNTLQSINNSLNIKLNRRLNIRLNYIPLFRELKSESVTIKDRNQIMTAILSYTPRAKRVTSQFNALYSNYLVNVDSGNINFENFTYTQQLQFKSGFKTGFNASWFKNNLQDTLGNDTWLGVLDIGYSAKNGGNFSIGGKMAYKEGIEIQYGFLAKVSIKVYKGLFWEAEAEKILIGDYYNSFIIGQIEKFPYYCNTRLVLTF